MPDTTISIPIVVFKFLLWPLKLGFKARNEVFPWLQKNQRPDPGPSEPRFFGYVEYPPIYHYAAPKGFREQPRPYKIKNARAVQAKAMRFFSKVVCDFDCNVASSSLGLDSSREYTAADLVAEVIQPLSRRNLPSTILVKGSIGCGKSTLLSAMMYSMWQKKAKNQGWVNMPIRVDLRETLRNLIDPILQDKIPNDENYCDKIEQIICQRIQKLLRDNGIKIQEPNPTFSEIIDECGKRQTNPIFIFDELDTLYYSFCIAYADPSKWSVSHEKMFGRYCSLVNYFLGLATNKLSTNVASPLVVLAGRSSTLELIKEVRLHQANLGKENYVAPPDCVISIKKPTSARAVQVIRTWVGYYHDQMANSGNDGLSAALSDLNAMLSGSEIPDFTRNLAISVHGLRHIMKVLGKAQAYDPSGKLLRFFVTKPNFMRVYQYLDGCEQYSQTVEGVSNVFLVNDEYCSDHERATGCVPEKLYAGHLQTYWLKYLVFKYICHHQRKHGVGRLTVRSVVDLFCLESGESKERTHYEKEVTLLLIVHATEVTHGRLLKLGAAAGASATVIASARAETFEMQDLYWEFSYLFVCIEDEWLPFPNAIANEFILDAPWMHAFNFSVSYQGLSNQERVRFVKYKAERVLIFLEVLDVSLRSEKRRYKTTFKRLKDVDRSIFSFDDYISKKKETVVKSILSFTESYVGQDYVEEVASHLRKYTKSREFLWARLKIKLCYAKYDRSWTSFRPITSHMREYHWERSAATARR